MENTDAGPVSDQDWQPLGGKKRQCIVCQMETMSLYPSARSMKSERGGENPEESDVE